MIYLILSVICSTLNIINFKLFARYRVKTIQAIVINYTVCITVGLLAEGKLKAANEIVDSQWFFPSILLGSLFITIFYLTAMTVKYSGVAVTSIAGKLSLIIPTIAAYFLYGDIFNFLKIAGICIAVLAIFFTVYKKDEPGGTPISFQYYLFPLLILTGNGIIDTLAKYNQENYVEPEDFNFFLVFVFGTSALMGWVILLIRKILYHENLQLKSIVAGISLGIPNYGSMYFLIQALEKSGLASSTFFPVNNICVVLLSCLCAWLLFKEKLNVLNVIGIFLSVFAIVLIMLS
ncbi:MAG: EamA family transporter [Fimbriimonadaceae bacterium]|nr:EamA family transporter [Chitinophagales bacterium]